MSTVKYGQEHGTNLIKIAKKLLNNQNLCKLLVNSDLDPLNNEKHPDIEKPLSLLHKNINVIPFIRSEDTTTNSKIVLLFDSGEIGYNKDSETISLSISLYCPFKEWLITGDTLRPFAIMSEIRNSLQDKRVNGLGEIRYLGFTMSTLTEEMGSFIMRFSINAFS